MDSGSGDMPTIRTIRPTDLVPLISFFRDGSHCEITARVWPEVWDSSNTRVVWNLISRLVTRPGDSQVWVCLGGSGVTSLGIARPRAGNLAWDVANLFVSEDDRTAAVDLLEHLAGEASRKGVRRVFLSTPQDNDLGRIAKQAGFINYTSETLYSCPLPVTQNDGELLRPRPRLRQDTHALFRLYNSAVPCRVRSAEAITLDEWISLEKGNRLWAPSLGGSRQHFVWEEKDELVGWLQLSFGAKSQHVELLAHPSKRKDIDNMVLYALTQISPRAPVYVSVREYQPEVASVLQRLGATAVVDYLICARELAVRVPSRALAPAGA